ncbi:hypothetical protein GCM10010405_43940 [Streptomyces macrosporus]|uniref:Transposase n=1 Tax=Streptomyces macrosporus TaxID=44032 RepID=A0ABP5XG69_9ACTN
MTRFLAGRRIKSTHLRVLVRDGGEFAVTRARQEVPRPEREAAEPRVVDWYTEAREGVMNLVDPHRRRPAPAVTAGVTKAPPSGTRRPFGDALRGLPSRESSCALRKAAAVLRGLYGSFQGSAGGGLVA